MRAARRRARSPAKSCPRCSTRSPRDRADQYLGSFSDSRDVEAPQGALLDFVAGNEQEIRVLKKPFGVGFTPDGFPVAVDMKQDCLAVFDLRNGVFEQDYPAGGAVLERPLALCYGPDGERYVADGTRQVVIVTDPSGTFVRTLGDPASLKVGGIAASAAFVFVGDLGAREVEVYDRKSGVLVRTFAGEGRRPWAGR